MKKDLWAQGVSGVWHLVTTKNDYAATVNTACGLKKISIWSSFNGKLADLVGIECKDCLLEVTVAETGV